MDGFTEKHVVFLKSANHESPYVIDGCRMMRAIEVGPRIRENVSLGNTCN
jgi:hypothetical protein